MSSIFQINDTFQLHTKHIEVVRSTNLTVSRARLLFWVLDKILSLVGENTITTVLDGEGESLLILSVVASDVTVRNFTVKNTRADQPAYGISIKDSQNVSLVDVTVEESYTGLVLDHSSLCEVVNSVFKNSYAYGVNLRDNSINNTVVGNWIVANPTGIAIMDMMCENNRFHHNNFVNNTNQIDVTYAGPNIWDDRNEGNYWSNYNGTDLDSDGIGDTHLPWESVDQYPLINPYWLLGDVNHDLKIDIYDVVRITGIYGSEQGDPNWNCHCDIAEPYGIINIYDVVTCTKDYRKEYIP